MSHEPQISPESLDLMRALLARPHPAATARGAFQCAYPDAPQPMIEAAVFHVVSEGIQAAIDWLAAIELFLRDSSKRFDYGATWHIVYHLYNWQQFEALLPIGRDGFQEHLRDIESSIAEGDSEGAGRIIKELLKSIGGDVRPPDIE